MNILENPNFIKVSRFMIKPVWVFLGFVFVVFVMNVTIIYSISIPKYMSLIQSVLTDKELSIIEDLINKLIINIGMWAVVLFVFCIFLVFSLRDAKKLVKDIETENRL